MPAALDSRAVLEHYVRAAEAGDELALRECFDPNATWQLDGRLPISGTWQGRDAILNEFLATAMRYYEPGSVRLEITRIVVEGDHAVMAWTSRARAVHGEPYENHCIGLFTVRDGRITRVHEYMDTLYAYETAFAGAEVA